MEFQQLKPGLGIECIGSSYLHEKTLALYDLIAAVDLLSDCLTASDTPRT